jgi:hypothetical protein
MIQVEKFLYLLAQFEQKNILSKWLNKKEYPKRVLRPSPYYLQYILKRADRRHLTN